MPAGGLLAGKIVDSKMIGMLHLSFVILVNIVNVTTVVIIVVLVLVLETLIFLLSTSAKT